jgi:hypothetical protein
LHTASAPQKISPMNPGLYPGRTISQPERRFLSAICRFIRRNAQSVLMPFSSTHRRRHPPGRSPTPITTVKCALLPHRIETTIVRLKKPVSTYPNKGVTSSRRSRLRPNHGSVNRRNALEPTTLYIKFWPERKNFMRSGQIYCRRISPSGCTHICCPPCEHERAIRNNRSLTRSSCTGSSFRSAP